MTDMASLEKEEKMWKNATNILNEKEIELEDILSSCKNCFDEKDESIVEKENEIIEMDKINEVVLSINLSAQRINDALEQVYSIIEESDQIRKELYDKYNKNHKFDGYLGASNPKALISSLALI